MPLEIHRSQLIVLVAKVFSLSDLCYQFFVIASVIQKSGIPFFFFSHIRQQATNYSRAFAMVLEMSCQWAWVAVSEDFALAAFF